MPSLYGICVENLTYTPDGTRNPRTGEVTPGTPRTVKGRFTRKQVEMKNSQGQDTISQAEAYLLPSDPPKIGERLQGLRIEAIEDLKDKAGQLLGYRVRM